MFSWLDGKLPVVSHDNMEFPFYGLIQQRGVSKPANSFKHLFYKIVSTCFVNCKGWNLDLFWFSGCILTFLVCYRSTAAMQSTDTASIVNSAWCLQMSPNRLILISLEFPDSRKFRQKFERIIERCIFGSAFTSWDRQAAFRLREAIYVTHTYHPFQREGQVGNVCTFSDVNWWVSLKYH